MNLPALVPKTAWLPLTPRGVAAFARARWSRLFLVQFIVALGAAGAVGWFLWVVWFPTIGAAIANLPEQSQIKDGTLLWPRESPCVLAENHFLSIAVDLDHTGQATTTSPVRIEFGRHDWQVSSLLGTLHLPRLLNTGYPRGYVIAFSRSNLGPWWEAREPFLIALAVLGAGLYLFCSWAVLATVYFVPAWLVAFFLNRELSWGGSWRLAGAALMPGALLMAAAILLYGLQWLDFIRLGLAFCLHLVIAWVYLFVGPLFLPRVAEVPGPAKNPFAGPP
ncbi:MAG TPA: hypothetical protein VFV96_06550 [Verrucomicrobiae bacterium]|nr:hypothetical protein [Verrucomicrobiae bacterium]